MVFSQITHICSYVNPVGFPSRTTLSWMLFYLDGIVLFEKIKYLANKTREQPSKLTSTVFYLLKWTQTYLLTHHRKYYGSKTWQFLHWTRNFFCSTMTMDGLVHSSLKETFLNPFLVWPWVTDPDPRSCTFCQMVLSNSQKTPLWNSSRVSRCLLRVTLRTIWQNVHDPGSGQWARVTGKNGIRKVSERFLLKKSVSNPKILPLQT